MLEPFKEFHEKHMWKAGIKFGRRQGLEKGLMIGFFVGVLSGVLITTYFCRM